MFTSMPSPFMLAAQIPFPLSHSMSQDFRNVSKNQDCLDGLNASSFDAACILMSLKSGKNRSRDGKRNKRKACESVDDQVNETAKTAKTAKSVNTDKVVRAA